MANWQSAGDRRGAAPRATVLRWRLADPRALAERLDDKGCAFGRVTAARLEDLTRAHDRLEAKLNAILIAVAGTFVSTLVGLAVSYLRSH